ncbi:MAG: TonB C-terminal domain-containing protein [Leptolyngbya sp.]|nr:TonB C-terminal domain-containing protein [Candidatus Melainabacteria bacterium]
MSNGTSRISGQVLRFVYFAISACSLIWMLAQYGQVNFISALIIVPAFAYLALLFVNAINLFKGNKFLVGSSVDVLSLGSQRIIHGLGILLPIPVLLYVLTFSGLVFTFNDADGQSVERTIVFSNAERALFGTSVIWRYLPGVVFQPAFESTDIPQPTQIKAIDVDFAPFMIEIESILKSNWNPPTRNVSRVTGVMFRVAKDGTVSDIHLSKSSGDSLMDAAGIKALQNTPRVAALPDGSPDTVDVDFTFTYNVNHEQTPGGFQCRLPLHH